MLLLMAGGACADDVPGVPGETDTDGTSTTDTPPSTVTAPTNVDSTDGDTTASATTADTEATTADTEATTTDPTSGAECGNGILEAGEECDADDLGGADCASEGFIDGTLACNADCTFDTSQCIDAECGNGTAEGKEACDTDDLAGATCETEGFTGGEIACAADCSLDTTGCTNIMCGNDAIEAAEVCDGADLGGEDCVSQGYASGTLGCAADCSALDPSGCIAVCAHDACEEGAALEVGCDPCVDMICAADADCCASGWDADCVAAVATVCGATCPATCGNDLLEAPEACDGVDLGGETCETQGFGAGTLACAGDCLSFDTSMCPAAPCFDTDIGTLTGPAVGSGNLMGDDNDLAPSCGGTDGNDHVLQFTTTIAGSYVFDTIGSSFDTKLALFTDCSTELACNDDLGGGPTTSRITQDLAAGQQILIVVDGYNGAVGDWVLNITPPPVCGDGLITPPEACDGANVNGQTCASLGIPGGGALACQAACNALDLSGCVGPFSCEDEDIGMAIGSPVTMGTTAGADNDLNPSCGLGDAPDQVVRFQAPATAQYTFSTDGSPYDTIIALFSSCSTQLACDDDGGVGNNSLLVRNMVAGEVVLVLVDGYNGATGAFNLNITSP